jgi:hypothetical protein
MLNIPEDLEDKFIVIADINNKTIEEKIVELIEEYIEKNEHLLETKQARKLLD